jgi:biotin carboxyl carrier protein
MPAKLFATVRNAKSEILLERATPLVPWSLQRKKAVDLVRVGPSQYSVVIDGRSHHVVVLKEDRDTNTARLRIGAHTFTVTLQDDRSRLMQTLGMDKVGRAVSDLKAPMPGLVLTVLVKPGDSVKKNDPVLILEAMKMENVIKASGDAVVKSIAAEQGKPVEKGQLLVSFA